MPTSPRFPSPPRRGWGRIALFLLLLLVLIGGGTALSFYVDALWFNSLGLGSVFWTTLNVKSTVFAVFAVATFTMLYVALVAIGPDRIAEQTGGTILINGQPVVLPVGRVIRLLMGGASLFVAAVTAFSMAASWQTFALYWYSAPAGGAETVDPIFGRQLTFYLFTLPVWNILGQWITTLAVLICLAAVVVAVFAGGARAISRRVDPQPSLLRAVSLSGGALLLSIAWQIYLDRFDRLFQEGRVFTGVTYADAHVTLTGLLIVAVLLALGGVAAIAAGLMNPRARWLVLAVAPGIVAAVGLGLVGAYVRNFVVRPNELARERPYIAHNIEFTHKAFALDRVEQRDFPAESGVEAMDAADNQETLQNVRLWDWRALQDTLRQIQEIRSYYDFPDIDIDRYRINGKLRQVMLAVRELNTDRLPANSRTWINERLVYTHGYGVTMNTVDGFTPEGLPDLLIKDMPVVAVPDVALTRPEVYFGELTNSDVYVKTRQREFNYPQGETNSTTSYDGTGGIVLNGFMRRLLIALDRGDLTKLPFSDAITPESRLLMRRNIQERVASIAGFLTIDPDPYMVIDNGRLFWMMDGFTSSNTYPYAARTRLGNRVVNYLRNSVKVVVDAYNGSVDFYVFDSEDPIIAAYRRLFPDLFKDASAMPAGLRAHVRYPELMLDVQAAIYGLYHMTNPDVFYNREDLWTVASETTTNERRETAAQTMEPNFVLMRLPGEDTVEFIEILPLTPANRNNMIGWIAGRSDDPHYGAAIAYQFPKTRLIDGPLQIEARIDQNPQLSGQMSLWNQEGSHVRRGALIVIPVGKALLYVEPIYLQAERSPMPELRIVVLALQDRLAYGSTYEAALNSLLTNTPSTLSADGPHMPMFTGSPAASPTGSSTPRPAGSSTPGSAGRDALIAGAAQDLADYQRLTSEGKLGEAGEKLEALKQKLEQLVAQQP
jgi:uncharacterized membrane protein (UPF0182 family)